MDVSMSRLADEKATFAVCEDEHANRLDDPYPLLTNTFVTSKMGDSRP